MIKKALTCKSNDTVSHVIKLMSKKNDKNVKGIIAVLSNDNEFIGCFADGDLRRIINNNADLNLPISHFMIKDPIYVFEEELKTDIALNKISKLEIHLGRKVKNIFVINKNKELIGLIDKVQVKEDIIENEINDSCIMGLGFVGLTVACHISA